MLAKLGERIETVAPRCAYAGQSEPWQKNTLAPTRMGARARQERNHRIKVRDQWTCKGCGRITTELDVDHKIPLSQGGTEDDANLQCLCRGPDGCHEAKSKVERGNDR